ncbi:hypothetical protein QZH41_012387 [Actinostola sp. cb2023]|nr:hypothetical protein QZH41_012387 [Actinostola sp. cb2023]
MGDVQEIVVFTLPVLLISVVVLGLCCTFCCYLIRSSRRSTTLSSTSSDVEQPRRPFPSGLKKVGINQHYSRFDTNMQVNYKSKWLRKTTLKDDMCTICLDDFKAREEINLCKCGHAYHHKCIMKWLEIKDTCPICQRNVRRKTRTAETTPLLHPQSLGV